MRLLALVLALCLAAPARAEVPQGIADLLPPGAYGQMLGEALADPVTADWTALRAAYAADPAYTGRSQLREMAGAGAPYTEDDVLRAIFADFPLLDTHVAAYTHYEASELPNREKMMRHHAGFYAAILEAVLATERPGEGGPVYTVLSVGEEYAVLNHLQREPTMQALINLDGVPHDLQSTAEGPVYFDISAFFGR